MQALLVGVALSISAIPATVKVLSDLGLLHTKVGEIIVSAAVFDDILGLFLLAILLAMIETGQLPDVTSMVWLLAKVAIFFAVTMALGAHVYPRVQKGIRAMRLAAIDFSALTIVSLGYGWMAEALGMHWILGAFMAGLYFERSRVGMRAYNEIKLICGAVTSGILAPPVLCLYWPAGRSQGDNRGACFPLPSPASGPCRQNHRRRAARSLFRVRSPRGSGGRHRYERPRRCRAGDIEHRL